LRTNFNSLLERGGTASGVLVVNPENNPIIYRFCWRRAGPNRETTDVADKPTNARTEGICGIRAVPKVVPAKSDGAGEDSDFVVRLPRLLEAASDPDKKASNSPPHEGKPKQSSSLSGSSTPVGGANAPLS
jgi:hypothetical protein